jgi:uncharacterized protein DUF4282
MQKGFFASLFDISFSSLITTKVIKVVYVISMVVIGLAALVFIIAAAASDDGAGGLIFAIIVTPIFALLYLIYTRIILEVIIVLFRIMESNLELVELQRRAVGPAAAAPSVPSGPSTPPPQPPSTPPEAPSS